MKRTRETISGILSILIFAACLFLQGCSDKSLDIEKNIKIHMERSNAYQKQGQFRAATIEARNIISLDKSRTIGYVRLAELYFELGNYKGASAILEQIREIGSTDIELLLAKSYSRQGKFISADNALSNYIKTGGDPESIKYKLTLARTLAGQKRIESAIGILNTIIEKNPENIDTRILLSTIYLNEKKFEEAETSIKKTLDAFPTAPEALYMSARVANYHGEVDKAEKLLSEAVAQLPETDILLPLRLAILGTLSNVLTQQGRTTEALIYAKLIASYSPEANEAKIKFGLALELLNSGNIDEAEKLFEELYAAYPNNEKTAFYLGLINYQQGEFDNADTLFSNHLDTEIAPLLLIETAALNSFRLNKTQQAIKILEQSLATRSDDSLLLGLYGISTLKNPETESTALLNIQKSLALNPDQDNLRLVLARFYLSKGQLEQASAHLNIILKKEPGNIPATSIYLDYLSLDGKSDEAEKIAENLLSLSPDDSEALNLIAKFNLRNKNTQTAKNLYLKSLKVDPDNLEALNYLAYIALEENSAPESISYFDKIIQVNPKSPFAYKSIIATLEADEKPEDAITTVLAYTDEPYSNDIKTTANAVIAEYYLVINNTEKAVKHINIANAGDYTTDYIDSVSSQVDYSRAKQAFDNQDWNTARQLLVQASPGTIDDQKRISQLLIAIELQSNQTGEARRLIESLSKQYPGEDFIVLAKARLFDTEDNGELALKYLNSEWDKNHSPAIARDIYNRLNSNPSDQEAFLLKWSRQDPTDDKPFIYLALKAQQAGNKTLAIKFYERAAQINSISPNTLNNLAWLYYETTNPIALETAKRAYDLDPDNPAILDTYGWILVNSGNRELGINLLEKALNAAENEDKAGIKSHLEASKKVK